MFVYTSNGFRASAAKAGTAQAKTRPLTLNGTGTTIRFTLSDAEFSAWMTEQDAGKRAALLGKATSKVIETGKVQVTTSALRSWRERVSADAEAAGVTPREHAAAVLSSGVVILDNSSEDHTDDVLADLFAE